jgi:hypothetical protein
MMNLLDNPNDVGMLSLGLRLLSTPGKFGQALGTAGLGAMGDMQQAKQAQAQAQQRVLQEQIQRMQLDDIKRKQAQEDKQRAAVDQFRAQIPSPLGAANAQAAQSGAPLGTMAAAASQPKIDPQELMMYQAMQAGLLSPLDYVKAKQKDNTPIKLGAGETLLQPGTYKPLFTNPKEDALPSSVREFEYAQQRPEFGEFLLRNKKAGATNIGLKVENKMGDSLAGQVGPMLKDSRVATDGAVKMFDAADRIGKALDSNKVSAGPLASKIQTVRQFAQVVGGGNDESIRQTRQVIKSLAQMSVEARKQLQGQGQVTESEAAAVAKADAGDINDLTTGELRDLVTLTKRAAHFQAQSHNKLLETMAGSEVTRPTVPFYQVRGTDALLKHRPELPQIGGAPNVDSLVEKYRTK